MNFNFRKVLSIILIVSGIAIFFYPTYEFLRTKYWEYKLLADYEASLQNPVETMYPDNENSDEDEDEEVVSGVLNNLDGIFSNYDDRNRYREGTGSAEETSSQQKTKKQPPKLNVIGKITISKINLKMPVLDTTNDTTLNYGATHIDGTTGIGKVGNCGIAGHRGIKYGYLFNRLNELESGDEIIVETRGVPYKYIVTSTMIVDPSDTSVLNRNKVSSMLTLVTCDPIRTATHRLIVHAILKEPVNPPANNKDAQNDVQKETNKANEDATGESNSITNPNAGDSNAPADSSGQVSTTENANNNNSTNITTSGSEQVSNRQNSGQNSTQTATQTVTEQGGSQ